MNKDNAWQNFINQRKEERLDLNQIREWFRKKFDFESCELTQHWRHVTGKVKRGGKLYFLKMATQSDIGQKTQNEVEFNQQIIKSIRNDKVDFFVVPRILETGFMEEKFFYISEYFAGKCLMEKNFSITPKSLLLAKYLETIAKINLYLMQIKGFKFAIESGYNIETKWFDSIKPKIDRFYDETKKTAGLEKVKKIFDEYDLIKEAFGLCHCDFVPWHMLLEGDKVVLFDAEHAGNLNPKFYDTAYFFTRIYTYGRASELAKKYIQLFKKNMKIYGIDDEYFKTHFQPILATRIIGAFWDAQNDKVDLTIFQKMRDEFLSGCLY